MHNIIKFMKTNTLLHIITNWFLFGNIWLRLGKKNRIFGRLQGLFLLSRMHIHGSSNEVHMNKGCIVSRSKIFIKGNNNKIVFPENYSLRNVSIWMIGNNNTLIFGQGGFSHFVEYGLEGDYNEIIQSNQTKLGGFIQLGLHSNRTMLIRVYASEGKKIVMGSNCAVSDGVTIRTGDGHAIYNSGSERINIGEDVVIDDNVWVCSGATILKGAGLGNGCILGNGSILTKDFSDEKNAVIAGMPAKVIKRDITWKL